MAAPPERSSLELLRPLEEGEHRPGDGVAGRLGAGGEQQREEGGELVVAQSGRLGVGEFGVDDRRQHVRAGTARFSCNECRAVFVQQAHRGLPLGGHGEEVGLVGNVEDVLDRVEEEMTVGLRHAEQEADRLHRELGGHLDQEVALLVDRLDEPAHPAPQLRLQVPHGGRRQAPGDQPADAGVPGVVHHVEHDPGDGQVLNDRPPVGTVASGLRGVGHAGR